MTRTIRRATEHDSDGILNCLARAFEPYREAYTPNAFLDTVLSPETLAQRFRQMTIFVAVTSDEAVIGTIACADDTNAHGHIRGMAVLPEWQSHGVATALLRAALDALRARECVRVSLGTTAVLERAIAFYVAHGFRPTGLVSDFFGMPLYEYALA